MIKYIEFGDIFALPEVHCYAHGCNCAGAMGKGIALQFRYKYPDMYIQYKELCKNGLFQPGDVFEYRQNDEHVFNLGTQKDWKTKAIPDAIKNSVRKMLESATEQHITAIAIPKIGAGLGGLIWEDVKRILEEVVSHFPNVDLIVVENYKQGIKV